MLQVLQQIQNWAAGNFHIPGGLCRSGRLHPCAQQPRASDQTVRAFRNILATRLALQLSEMLQIPKMEKNNLDVIIQS